MIKKTLYFGNNAYLHTKDNQLVIDFADKEKEAKTVPIEDIGVVILDAYQLTVSQNLITKLLDNNAALITCNEKHLPQGLMLNLDGNYVQQEKFTSQINASEPLKKNLWQQTVKAKIRNQANLLVSIVSQGLTSSQTLTTTTRPIKVDNMIYWEKSVRSGDPDNYEGRAAAFYWKKVFVDYIHDFKRGRFEEEPNNLLNYGYAILRAVVARSLVGSGLLPTLGIHHHNKYNAYCLADDIMEPYRPYVDKVVLKIVEEEEDIYDLNPAIKQKLLMIPALDVVIEEKKSPLMVAMQRTTASLAACFEGSSRRILYPVF